MSGRWVDSTRRHRLPPGWSTVIVPRILARDQGICHWCGHPGADAVDHKQAGDDHSDTNLGAIHQDVAPYCHRTKNAHEGNAGRAARRATLRHPDERHPGAR